METQARVREAQKPAGARGRAGVAARFPFGDRVAGLPPLATAAEVANLLRTSRKAVYLMAARGQLPGVIKIGRRTLFETEALLDWLDQKRVPSPKE